MRLLSVMTGAVLLLPALAVFAVAQDVQPAEIPPASYEGRQYVDSQGCVFLRGGVDGDVLWVPRVNRDRKQICGQTPSLSPEDLAAAASEDQETPLEAEANTEERADSLTTDQVAPDATEADRVQGLEVVGEKDATQPEVGQSVETPDAPAVPSAPDVAAGATEQPLARTPRVPSSVATDETPPVLPEPRVLPKHIAKQRAEQRPQPRLPSGYAPTWEDDRLNPQRAEQTVQGHQQMAEVWSSTVPRTLNEAEQSKAVAPKPEGKQTAKSQKVATGRHFVQIGAYAVPGNATRAVRRMSRAGFDVHVRKARKGRQTLRLVMVGPFATRGEARVAVRQARAAGYHDAYLKR